LRLWRGCGGEHAQERTQDSKNNTYTFHTSSIEFAAGDLDG
jgi:hypothetical protein